jgi:ABC-2 type transport system permease protein
MSVATATGVPAWVQPGLALFRREIARFFLQRGRVIGVLGTALIFWGVLGFGLGSSFRAEGLGDGVPYQAYFFPGVLGMILLFTSIFASFSLIEDRNEGFLQGVLVAPVSPLAIVFGKVAGGTAIATLQGMLFLLLAPLAGVKLTFFGFLAATVVMIIVGAGLSALGFVAAWRSNSIQGFHGVMNLVLLPMWFLSGAIFPASGAGIVLKILMWLNPMTYGVALIRHALRAPIPAGTPPGWLSILVCLAFTAAMIFLAKTFASRATAGDLK